MYVPLSNDSGGRSRGKPPSSLYGSPSFSSAAMSPLSTHSFASFSIDWSLASALARNTPLMPPADVPVRMSTTIRHLTGPSAPAPAAAGLHTEAAGQVAVHALGAAELVIGQVQRGAVGRGRAGAHEREQLLDDPVHVDGERHPAVQHDREANLAVRRVRHRRCVVAHGGYQTTSIRRTRGTLTSSALEVIPCPR